MSAAISIIINNYNYARFLGRCIDSALAQRDVDAEVIVVDDGSSDDSRQVIERYGSRVRAIFQANAGQAAALNTGFALASGAVIIFLDADDELLPRAACEVFDAFGKERELARVAFRLEVIDAAGGRTGLTLPRS